MWPTARAAAHQGRYELAATVHVAASCEEVMRRLTTPEHMRTWMLGTDEVRALDADASRLAVTQTIGTAMGVSRRTLRFAGETVERGPRRLVRTYRYEGPGADPERYRRVVTYDLVPAIDGCELRCAVTCEIPGLPPRAIRPVSRAETRALRRALERLRLGAEGRRIGLLRRLRDGMETVQPL